MRRTLLLAVLMLAACGAEAPPEPVEGGPVRLDASASIGVTAEF